MTRSSLRNALAVCCLVFGLLSAAPCRAQSPVGNAPAVGTGPAPTTPDAGAAAKQTKEEARAPERIPSAALLEVFNGARRIVGGQELALEVPKDSQALLAKTQVSLHFGALVDEKRVAPSCKGYGLPLTPHHRTVNDHEYLVLRIPQFTELEGTLKPMGGEGLFSSHLARLCLKDGSGSLDELVVEVADPSWALVWGICAVTAVWVGLWLLLNFREKVDGAEGRTFRFPLWNPLGAVIDRSGRYSLSLAQSLLWTYVTAFGIVFVWKITEKFLDITPQVLILLGIGGTTALLTNSQKLARWQEIDERFRAMIRAQGKPALADLVTEDGVASVPKAQMLIFTLLISFTVVKQIWEAHEFPALSEGLVALMGISGALYVGNSVQRADTLETVKQRITAYETKAAASQLLPNTELDPKDPERVALVQALRNYLL